MNLDKVIAEIGERVSVYLDEYNRDKKEPSTDKEMSTVSTINLKVNVKPPVEDMKRDA